MIYGYVRVSTKEQNEERQMIAMRDFGVDRIYLDKQSGKDFQRVQYQKLLRKLKKDDVLVIKSIDRLGRNYDDILVQWRAITKEKREAIVVLDMPLLDTRQNRDLTGTLIADIVLQLLSYVAQTEREFIRQRQAEGIAAAKARGVKFGREAIPISPEFGACAEAWSAGLLSTRDAAVKLGVCQNTFLKWMKGYDSQKSTVSATLFHFGVLSSNVHNAWMRTVAGRLEMRYQYSNGVVYNTFPWPEPMEAQRAKIEQTAQAILDARALYPEASLAKMYGEYMYLYPELLAAHQANDRAVMQAYGFDIKTTTEASCVAELMKRYQALTDK